MARTIILGFAALLFIRVSTAEPISMSGRFVRIELPGTDGVLSLTEVQVYRGTRNIAPEGTAKQSTTFGDAVAKRAHDGNIDGDYFAGSVSNTMVTNHPWWELDLGKAGEVTRIVVYNRTDCCRDRIAPANVVLLNDAREIVWQGAIESERDKYTFDIRPAPLPAGRNLLRNAGFLERTNPPLPDYWDLDHIAAVTFRNLHQQFGVDDRIASPVAGTNVLKVVNSEDDFPYTRVVARDLFAKLPEGPYTFSAYLRSNRNGARLNVRFSWADGPTVVKVLSSEWKRYTMTLRVTAADAERLQPVLTFPDKGEYFIAAPQLESGTRATPFVPFADRAGIDINSWKRNAHDVLDRINGRLYSKENPKLTASFEYDFYSADPVARLVLFSNYESPLVANVRCGVPAIGAQLGTDSDYTLSSGASTQVVIPISGLPDGEHVCRIEASENGAWRARASAGFRKMPPGASEVRINHLRRFISLNGTPFFIVGMGVGSWKIPDDWYFKDLASHGINTVFYTSSPDKQGKYNLKQINEFVSASARHNLKVIVGIPLAGEKPRDWKERLREFLSVVQALKNNPAVIGWFPVDEPNVITWRGVELDSIYTAIKQVDPYRPVFLNWVLTEDPAVVGKEPLGTLNATDIHSSTYYPFTGARGYYSMDGFIANTERLAGISRLFHKVSHSWLQLFGGIHASREPTGDELAYMAYLSLANGSMISYWDTKSNSSLTWARLAEIHSEINFLANELYLSPEAAELVAPVHEAGFMRAAWKKGRRVYLLVLNDRSVPAKLHFAVAHLSDRLSPTANVLFSDRRVETHAGYLDDNFMPYERRIYVFDTGSPRPP